MSDLDNRDIYFILYLNNIKNCTYYIFILVFSPLLNM